MTDVNVNWKAVLTEAADRAGAALDALEVSAWSDDLGIGADGTTTVAADAAAEAAALTYLADAVPGASLCSEEAGVTHGDGDALIIVDPVDGTNNALRGIPYWAFAAGVVIHGEPRVGFVRNVPAGIDYFADKDRGAESNGRAVRAARVTRLGDATLLLQRPAEPDALDVTRDLLARCRLPRMLGAAALDIAAVGAGSAHAYVNPNSNTAFGEKVVDYAAAAVFCEAAGGTVTDARGIPLGFAPDLGRRARVVAAAHPELHDELLALLATGSEA